jgi:polar amino acid transport system substrate-binding protein
MVAVPIFADCIRLGLFLPQYSKAPDGALIPSGAGVVARELIATLASRLKTGMRIVELPTPPIAIETVNAGGCDVLIIGIEPARRALVDFTPTVIQFDYACLVPAGSTIGHIAEVDRPGIRISVVQGHASYMTLMHVVKQADILGTDLPDEAFGLLRDGKSDVFALPREQLLEYATMLPGSRILKDGYGVNDVAFAVGKGLSERLSLLSEFVESAKRSGLIQQILDSADLGSRGFNVGPLRV